MSSSLFFLKRSLVVGGAVLVLGGSAVGLASAQTAPATPAPQATQTQSNQQAFLDALAKRLNVTTAALQTAISSARTDLGLPADGGFGLGGRGERVGGRGVDFNTAATTIGIPVAQLQQELATKSLADVATAHGKTAAQVATALKNAAHQRIDQEVTAGRLTADQATQAKQQADQRIDQLLTQVGPANQQPAGPRGAARNPNGTPAGNGGPSQATPAGTAG